MDPSTEPAADPVAKNQIVLEKYSVPKQPNKPLLLVLDLNGTIIDRKKSKSFIMRPGLSSFLNFALSNFAVMIWSSAQPQNVMKMVKVAFGTRIKKLVAIWDRRYCILHGGYHEKCLSEKDLSKIWTNWSLNTPLYAKSAAITPNNYPTTDTIPPLAQSPTSALSPTQPEFVSRWDIHNTILIDDSENKAVNQPNNHICIKKFSPRNDPRQIQDDIELLRLECYLTNLLEYRKFFLNAQTATTAESNPNMVSSAETASSTFDVRRYIIKNKYQDFELPEDELSDLELSDNNSSE